MSKLKETITQNTTEKQSIYIIKNRLTQAKSMFYHPIEARAIEVFLNSINSEVSYKPEDFELIKIGEWNKKTNELKPIKEKIIAMGKYKKFIDKELQEVIAKIVIQVMNKEKGK